MIEIKDLTKKFGDFTAVDQLNMTINTGEFFGLLGPNGAGKTTTISMMSTVLLPTSGEIFIDGKKLDRKASAEKRKLSVITQEYSMRQDMTMDEVMEYQGRLYFMSRKAIKQKSEELLEFAGLQEFRKRTVRHLSGGMKRKLMICRALMIEPEILLLDEPTAGMDALSRRQMWNLLRQVNVQNMTIVLTTHYIEEAQALCERVALIDHGKLDTIDTPQALIEALGPYTVETSSEEELVCRYFHAREEAIRYLEELDAEAAIGRARADMHHSADEGAAGDRSGGLPGGATLRNTTLEDVFVERIGRRIEQK